MKIAIHIPDFNPEVGGGFTFQETIFEELLEIAPSTHHEFIFYSKGKRPRRDLPKNVRFEELKNGFFNKIRYRLSEALRRFQDIYLNRRLLDFCGWFAADLVRKKVQFTWFLTPSFVDCGTPYIYTVWDLQHMKQSWFPEVSANGEWERRQLLLSRVIPQATRVIVPNQAGRDELLRYYPIEDSRVMMLPHPTPKFALQEHAVGGLRQIKVPYLFYPAQFWPHKNHILLLNLVRRLKAEGSNLSLVLCGSDKGNKEFIESQAVALGIADRIYFLGFVPIENLIALYRDAFALVYVTHFGPENLPPLEAFALGCPVIATSVAGADEQFGKAYLSIDPSQSLSDLELELYKRVQQLESDPQLRSNLIAEGKKRALKYSGQEYVSRIVQFLDSFEDVRSLWK